MGNLAEPVCFSNHLAVVIDITAKRSGFFSMLDYISQEATRFDCIWREPEHFQVASVADDQSLRPIEEEKGLGHVIYGNIQSSVLSL